MFVIVFSEFKTPRLVIGRLQYYHFYFIYSGSLTSNTKNRFAMRTWGLMLYASMLLFLSVGILFSNASIWELNCYK